MLERNETMAMKHDGMNGAQPLLPRGNADGRPEAQPEVVHEEPLRVDLGRGARVGRWALVLGFAGFLLWAAFAPLDEGVPSPGMVVLDSKRKPVQHPSGGIVRDVLVREGQSVKEGEVLLRLDPDVARANFESVRQRYLGLRAIEARLRAEQLGQSALTPHPDLKEALSDPGIRSQWETQQQLFRARRAALAADLQGIEESIKGQQALIDSYGRILTQRRQQLALLTDELGQTRGLVAEGYAPRNRQLELERMVAESNAAISDLLGNTARAQQAVAELRQRALARTQEYRKEVEGQLADVSREVEADEQKFIAAKSDLSRIEVRAPATGQVVGLVVQSAGAVIQPAQRLMDVVPDDEPVLLEARIAPNLIDKVHPGLMADVRFSAFAHSPQLVVGGELVSVSKDVLVDPQAPQVAYYLARIRVTPEGMKTLGNRHLQPGMPAEVVIKTGERSLLTYLLHPLTKRLAASLKEE